MDKKQLKQPLFNITFLVFVVFIVVPVIYAVFKAFTLSTLSQVFTKHLFILLLKSSLLAFIIAFFATVFGIILGFLIYKTKLKLHAYLKIVLLIPLLISPYILAVAWKDFFRLVFNNSHIISSYFGVIIVLVSVFTPLSMLIIGSALSNINASLEESGLLIMSKKKVFFKITMPLIKPALLSSFVLIFIFSISEFAVPSFFGVEVFTTEIFTQFAAFYNHSLALIQGSILLLICVLLLFIESNYLTNAPFLSINGKGIKHRTYQLENSNKWSVFILLWISITVFLPLLTLIYQTFKNGITSLVKAIEILMPTFSYSIVLAIIGSIIILFIGFVTAYYSINQKNRKTSLINTFMLFIFAIPSTIYGISLIQFYNQPFLNYIYSSALIIIIGYVGKFSFIASKIIANSLKQIPKSLDEVAQIQGVSFNKRLLKISIPLILPALFIAFVISFIFSLGELSTTIMLYPPGTEIMPIKVFTIMANAPQSLTSAMTFVVFLVTLLLIIGLYIVFNKWIIQKRNYGN